MRQQLTQGQAADAEEKARNNREGVRRAVRSAWSHVIYGEKSDATTPGKAFDLEHFALATKDRAAIPVAVYERAKADGFIKEKLGPETLALSLLKVWPAESPHLAIGEIAEWFSAHAYLPKLRDRVVLESSLREALGKFDAAFGYAERFDAGKGLYEGLIYAKAAPGTLSPGGLLVRAEVAKQQLAATVPSPILVTGGGFRSMPATSNGATISAIACPPPAKPRRFFGSVEIDLNRPVKAFDAIINAVVMELC